MEKFSREFWAFWLPKLKTICNDIHKFNPILRAEWADDCMMSSDWLKLVPAIQSYVDHGCFMLDGSCIRPQFVNFAVSSKGRVLEAWFPTQPQGTMDNYPVISRNELKEILDHLNLKLVRDCGDGRTLFFKDIYVQPHEVRQMRDVVRHLLDSRRSPVPTSHIRELVNQLIIVDEHPRFTRKWWKDNISIIKAWISGEKVLGLVGVWFLGQVAKERMEQILPDIEFWATNEHITLLVNDSDLEYVMFNNPAATYVLSYSAPWCRGDDKPKEIWVREKKQVNGPVKKFILGEQNQFYYFKESSSSYSCRSFQTLFDCYVQVDGSVCGSVTKRSIG